MLGPTLSSTVRYSRLFDGAVHCFLSFFLFFLQLFEHMSDGQPKDGAMGGPVAVVADRANRKRAEPFSPNRRGENIWHMIEAAYYRSIV